MRGGHRAYIACRRSGESTIRATSAADPAGRQRSGGRGIFSGWLGGTLDSYASRSGPAGLGAARPGRGWRVAGTPRTMPPSRRDGPQQPTRSPARRPSCRSRCFRQQRRSAGAAAHSDPSVYGRADHREVNSVPPRVRLGFISLHRQRRRVGKTGVWSGSRHHPQPYEMGGYHATPKRLFDTAGLSRLPHRGTAGRRSAATSAPQSRDRPSKLVVMPGMQIAVAAGTPVGGGGSAAGTSLCANAAKSCVR